VGISGVVESLASFISVLPDSRRAADGTAPAASAAAAAAADTSAAAAGRGAARGKAAAGPRLQKEEEEELPLEKKKRERRVSRATRESPSNPLSLSLSRGGTARRAAGSGDEFFFPLFSSRASAFSPLAVPLSPLSSLLGRPRATAHPQQRARGVEKERGLL